MRLFLKAELGFSDDLSKAKETIIETVTESNSTILTKGAPEGKSPTAEVTTINGDKVRIDITSGRHVRAHEALLRLKKTLAQKVGKEHHIGVRDVKVLEYSVEFELEKEPLEPVSVPFAKEVDFQGRRCRILLEDLDKKALSRNYMDRMVKRIQEKVDAQFYEGKGEYWEEMWYSGEKESAWKKDPTEVMVEKNWIKQGPTKGKWFFYPQLAKVMRVMESIAMEEMLKPLKFQEIIQSHHVPFDIWVKSGHMAGIANEAYYVCEPKTRDVKEWERFYDLLKITGEVPRDELEKMVTGPRAGICYAQCPPMYWALQGETLSDDDLPLLLIDRSANSNRYESGGRHGMERVDEFHRLEPIYIGTPKQLVDLRERMIARYKHIFNEILDLEWRMAWVTPFYMQQSGLAGIEETEEKVKGTIDFEAYMPYRGSREESEWLEFQNLSIVGDKFISAFNIKSQGAELWSGCSGIGLERWTAAFLAQKGLDPEKWPEAFKERFGDMPEGVQFY